jgi:hypothetical protein
LTKDAADLYRSPTSYAGASNTRGLYDRELDLSEAAEFDMQLAGAELLGCDVAAICDGRRFVGRVNDLANARLIGLFRSLHLRRFFTRIRSGRLVIEPELRKPEDNPSQFNRRGFVTVLPRCGQWRALHRRRHSCRRVALDVRAVKPKFGDGL